MDQNPKQRRRSNLGRRFRPSENPTRPGPVFPVPVPRGLGRSRSAKKTPSVFNRAANDHVCKKSLFLRSPDDTVSTNPFQWQFPVASRALYTSPSESSSNDLSNNSLNLTGINSIKTPSPVHKSTVPAISINDPNGHVTTLSSVTRFSFLEKLEPPKSPGPSHYNQFVLKELANVKPPVDPDDEVLKPINNNLKDLKLNESPDLKPVMQLSNIIEDLDSTDTFLLDEKTIIEENEMFKEPPSPTAIISCKSAVDPKATASFKLTAATTNTTSFSNSGVSSTNTVSSKPAFSPMSIASCKLSVSPMSISSCKSPVSPTTNASSKPALKTKSLNRELEDYCSDSDDELEQALQNVNTMGKQLGCLKKRLEKLLNKRNKTDRFKDKNKENIRVTPKKEVKNKWISSMKSEHPNLLKTPKITRKSLHNSIMEQSTIWTPHSLSSVLHEQMGDLFE